MSRQDYSNRDHKAPLTVTASPQAETFVRTGANRLWTMVRDSDNKIFLVASDILNVAKRRLEIQASDVSFPSGTVTISGGTLESALPEDAAPNIRLIRNVAPEIQFNRAGASLADYHKWKIYVSGSGSASGPSDSSLSFAAMTDDESLNLKTFRMYRDGRMLIGADPTAPLEVATKQYVDRTVGGTVSSSETSTSLALNVWTRINFPTPTDMRGGVTWNPTLKGFVVPEAGMYLVVGRVMPAANAGASTINVGISTQDYLPHTQVSDQYLAAGALYRANFSWMHVAAAGDCIGLAARVNLARNSDYANLSVVKLGN